MKNMNPRIAAVLVFAVLTVIACVIGVSAAPTNSVATATATTPGTTVPEAPAVGNTDEIDLEEVDDSAAQAKRPSVKLAKLATSTAKAIPAAPSVSSGKTAAFGTAENPALVDISCDDATLFDILRQFRKTTGANIIAGDSTNLSRRVSVTLTHVPWFYGLQSILNSRGFRLEPRGDIFVVTEDQQATPMFTRTFLLNHASAEDLAKLFNASFGAKSATAFKSANTVVLTATEKDCAEAEQIIKAVDRPVPQAYIEARFVELDAGAAKKLGIKWSSLANGWTTSVGPLTGGGTVGTTHMNHGATAPAASVTTPSAMSSGDLAYRTAFGLAGTMSVGEFAATIQALESMDGASTFSNPKIIVANEHKATVDMTTKFPNVRVTASRTTVSGSTSMDISAAIEMIPGEDPLLFAKQAFYAWGITLEVTPRISPDGLITVDIVPTISQLDTATSESGFYSVESSSGSDSTPYSKYPILAVKRITSQFTMKDGTTAVIGGLSKTVDEINETGIPGLRSIPWIGPRWFGWKSHVKTQKEIIIFVTVGLANPAALPKDIGLPKNAVLGREYVEGRRLEPGDRPLATSITIPESSLTAESEAVIPRTAATTSHGSGAVTIKPVATAQESGVPTVSVTPAPAVPSVQDQMKADNISELLDDDGK